MPLPRPFFSFHLLIFVPKTHTFTCTYAHTPLPQPSYFHVSVYSFCCPNKLKTNCHLHIHIPLFRGLHPLPHFFFLFFPLQLQKLGLNGVCMYVCMYAYMRGAYLHIYIYKYINIYIYILHTHTHTHTRIYIYIHVCVYIYAYIFGNTSIFCSLRHIA